MTFENPNADAAPRAERPELPQGYGVPEALDGVLSWTWAEDHLEGAKNYWVCTTRPDGRPHAVPVWGAWVDRCFYFDGGGVKARNLAVNPAIAVHLESGGEVVIVEGFWDKQATPDAALFERIRASYGAKYEYRPETPGDLYTVRPNTVLAWHKFPGDATRWRFGRASQP
jgi:hypothetical protein